MTKFKDLNMNNSFLFSAFMTDPENCRLVLELILGRPIGDVAVHAEHAILFNSDFKSVRLDVFLTENASVEYDLEMENSSRDNLAKRSRFYQAEMDVTSLGRGEAYDNLKPNYIIFICTFDPFRKKRYRYVFENYCKEADIPLNDGTCKIFLNTKGENADEVPRYLVEFLKYVENSTDACVENTQDQRISRLHERVAELKRNRTWEGHYMTLEKWLLDMSEERIEKGIEEGLEKAQKAVREAGIEEGREAGREEAREQFITLITLMNKDGLSDQMHRLSEEPEFLDTMLEKYNL